jgi:hypothetical protein
MHVDKAWEHSGLAEIDDPSSCRNLDFIRRTDIHDLVAFDEDDLVK